MYHDPKTVLSPKDRVKSVEVVYDAGPVDQSWSVAQLEWDDSAQCGHTVEWRTARVPKACPRRAGILHGLLFQMSLKDAVLNAAQELSQVEADGSGQRATGLWPLIKSERPKPRNGRKALIGDAY